MSTTRFCCCNAPNAGNPAMVKGGWYHFLVLNDDNTVAVLIGKLHQQYVEDSQLYSSCLPNGTANFCVADTIPVEPPAGHPLAVPASVLSTAEGSTGKAVKDICAGAYHCIVRHTDDSITCWGLNAMGQCNTPATLANGTHAKIKKIVGLHAGYSTSAVTFNDGTVLAWGDPEVCNVVNSWTDIMMSPPNNSPASGGRNSIDNYDAAKPQYAKPRYPAAYNADANLVTWNVQQDPSGYFHNLNEETHCSPMFDLGVETDPTNPLEYDPIAADSGFNALPMASEYSFIDPGKYVGAEYPFTDAVPNSQQNGYEPEPLDGTCDINCITNPNSDLWQDFLGMKWRNSVFNAGAVSGASNPSEQYASFARKSCCDLQIKKDYAVAIRRTGQMITTRNERGATSCPSNTYCRDCDADRVMTYSNPNMPNYNLNCPPSSAANDGIFCNQHPPCGPGEDDPYCGQDFTLCACCTNSTPSIYLGCPDCSSQQCVATWAFSTPGNSFNSNAQCSYYEGVGCMSVRPPDEAEWHDPNWADATSGGLTGRWTSGLQVLYGHGSNRPTANTASVAQNYGWTTIPAVDGMDNPRLAGFGERCQTNHYPSAQTCAEMCKSSGSWEVSAIEPQGTPVWNYPIQMFTQAVQAGTNAVMWTQLGKRPLRNMMSGGDGGSNSEDPNYPSCSGCGQPNDDAPMCRDAKYWSNVMPNSGPVTTSCLYSGTNKADPSRDSRDKYGFQNSHRRGAGDYIIGHCVSQPEMAQTINYTCVTKPWGPWSMGIWQGAGLENRAAGGVGYGNCHCCPPPTGQQIGPPGCAQVLQNDYTKSAYMDPIFGTYQGMPFESNMHCKSPPISPNGDTWCSANCLNVTFGWSGPGDNANWPYLAAPFCAHFPAKGVASTRMAFAVIRADHRKYDNASPANRLTPPGKCGNYSAEAPYANDPSQFFPCAPNAGGLTSEATARQSTMMLHIWGSLWDPCPPWPRVCDCTMKLPIDESNEACTVPYDSAEDFLLPPNHMYASPCDSDFGSYHPEGTAGPEEGTAIPFYPQWTRTPTSTSRSARKGHWSGTTWVQESPAANEPTVAATRYCPDCETYQQQFYREGAQVTPGE